MRVHVGFFFTTLAFAALAAGCSSSYNSPSSPSPSPSPSPAGAGTPVSVVRGATNLTTTAYAPSPIAVTAGDTVTWTNTDTTDHTATSDDNTWNSGSIAPGASFSRTFTSPGTFQYHCTIHPGMVGTVTVR